uniref:Uncharacterized protein n=1 Tax=Tanacetum cinerariifolium TaxID=118510 RepID=A0A6L2JCE8_TANCI|nr:hypothetical protein [Tanacetum cinerariifolium]
MTMIYQPSHALSCPRSISLSISLNPWISCRHSKTYFFHKKVAGVDYLLFHKVYSRKRSGISLCLLEDGTLGPTSLTLDPQFSCVTHYKSRRARHLLPFASADDGVTVNGSPEASTSGDVEEMRAKLDQSLQNEEYNSALIQSLHDAARVYELAIKEQSSASKLSWFSTAWLGIDQNAWVKALSYQASVYSLLLAACEISSRGDRRDRDINVFVQRSFVNYFEKDQRFAAATGVIRTGTSLSSGDASDRSLLLFGLSCIAAITKLGPTKVACTHKWLENPSNVKAARFLSRGHNILQGSMEELGIPKKLISESSSSNAFEITHSGTYAPLKRELDSFDKALESVDEALARLEELLQELHVSNSSSGKEHLKAACSDLEKMRKLKKEAEFLEASFRAKADSLRQGDDDTSSVRNKRQSVKGKNRESSKIDTNVPSSKPDGLWNFLVPQTAYRSDDTGVLESNEIQRFELLRNELIELERRVERSAKRSESEEDDIKTAEDSANFSKDSKGVQLVKVQEKEDIIGKSISKLKGTTTDVLQGTQLLAIDVGAATGLLRRAVIGDELTDKEKQALRRTLTDVASVIPIEGVLWRMEGIEVTMVSGELCGEKYTTPSSLETKVTKPLPDFWRSVTAVGHAAMLAAIQRYVPSLIPSTYGSERLDLLRQLEKVKEMETTESNSTESAD